MAAHATLGASSAERWMACPGSIRASEGLPDHTSEYAREGTVAHTLAEFCLGDGSDPRDWIGHAPDPDHPHIQVDKGMADAASVYVELLRFITDVSSQVAFEVRVSLDDYFAVENPQASESLPPMFGTADAVAVSADGRTLHVVDYKHGQGIPVEAKDNPQLRYYALGALFKMSPARREAIRKVKTWIVQPRSEHTDGPVRSDGCTPDTLLAFGRDLTAAALRTQSDDAPLVAGEHCRFCPAAGQCAELARVNMEKAKMVFSKQDGKIVPEKGPDQLTLDEMRQVLEAMSRINKWMSQVQERAHELLEQGALDEPDQQALGHKLVAKRATRKWRDPEAAADRLCEVFGLGDEEMYERKLRSPAQIEKEVGKAELKTHADVLDDLVVAESTGSTVVPLSDKREAIQPRRAKDVFGAT